MSGKRGYRNPSTIAIAFPSVVLQVHSYSRLLHGVYLYAKVATPRSQ
ncbi:hypothetical protein [Mucilaginibacter gilvus]|nr:hypothetical protein [Mucilaginibacter gilvus]